MTTEELLRELRGARSLLDRHEPDRRRGGWAEAATDLIALRRSLDSCSAELDRVLDKIDDPGDRESLRSALAHCHAEAAALFAASSDPSAARQLLRRAIEVGGAGGDLADEWRAAQADLDRFADLAYGRVRWRQGDIARAKPVLKRVAAGGDDRLASAAREVMDGPAPLTGPRHGEERRRGHARIDLADPGAGRRSAAPRRPVLARDARPGREARRVTCASRPGASP